MKPLTIIAIILTFGIVVIYSAETHSTVVETQKKERAAIMNMPDAFKIFCCYIRKPRTDCEEGIGVCGCHWGSCATGAQQVQGELQSANQEMVLKFLDECPASDLEIDENVELAGDICNEFGVSSITLIQGTYTVHGGETCYAILDVNVVE